MLKKTPPKPRATPSKLTPLTQKPQPPVARWIRTAHYNWDKGGSQGGRR